MYLWNGCNNYNIEKELFNQILWSSNARHKVQQDKNCSKTTTYWYMYLTCYGYKELYQYDILQHYNKKDGGTR